MIDLGILFATLAIDAAIFIAWRSMPRQPQATRKPRQPQATRAARRLRVS